jgi:hypothetical protein
MIHFKSLTYKINKLKSTHILENKSRKCFQKVTMAIVFKVLKLAERANRYSKLAGNEESGSYWRSVEPFEGC